LDRSRVIMSSAVADRSSLEASRTAAASAYAAQAAVVRAMRDAGTDCGPEFDAAKAELKDLRRSMDVAKKAFDDAVAPAADAFDRVETENLLKRRFFITPSFEIYGGVGGLYDYGPPGKFPVARFVC
jgi:glycyl-tRNA synthetase